MGFHWSNNGEQGYIGIPLRTWVQTKVEEFRNDAKVAAFNELSLEEKLKELKADEKLIKELLALSAILEPGIVARFGGSSTHERSCEISSGTYTNSEWDYFIVGEQGMDFRATHEYEPAVKLNRDGSRESAQGSETVTLQPIITTEGGKYFRISRFRAAFVNFPRSEMREGPIRLEQGWDGTAYVDKSTPNYRDPTSRALQTNPQDVNREKLLSALRE